MTNARGPILAGLLVLFSAVARAGDPPPITAVEVDSLVEREGQDLRVPLRKNVEQTITNLDWSRARVKSKYVLSTSLTRLETQKTDGAVKSTAVISAGVRDAKTGSIKMIIEGRASAGADGASQAEQLALQGAVEGALRSLPDAIRKEESR